MEHLKHGNLLKNNQIKLTLLKITSFAYLKILKIMFLLFYIIFINNIYYYWQVVLMIFYLFLLLLLLL